MKRMISMVSDDDTRVFAVSLAGLRAAIDLAECADIDLASAAWMNICMDCPRADMDYQRKTPMTDASELLPCPFCGGVAHLSVKGGSDERTGYSKSVYIRCTTCPASVFAADATDKNGWSIAKPGETEGRARAAWNRRILSALEGYSPRNPA